MSDGESRNEESAGERVERWLAEHGDYLFRYAKSRVLDGGMAEDLVQETLVTAYQGVGKFRGDSSERTWLTGIMRFKVMEYFRRRAREWEKVESVGDSDPRDSWFDEAGHWVGRPEVAGMDWEPDPSIHLDRKEFWDILHHCLKRLPARTAAAFVQREVEFLDPGDIQANLGITQSNLWVLLHRARNQLRRCIQSFWKADDPAE